MTPSARGVAAAVVAVAAAVGSAAPAADADRVGEVLRPWQPGGLDIHQISTGRGNAALLVFPDGTTLLVDAGEFSFDTPDTAPRPDGTRTPGEWIARYVARRLEPLPEPRLDYVLITHFHPDHMGWATEDDPLAANGAYRLSGITRVAESLPIGTLLDRGWPDYERPTPPDHPGFANYRAFLEWQRRHAGMRVERLRPGRADQIVLAHDPGAWPGFEVRGVAASGEVWTGSGEATRLVFPPPEEVPEAFRPTENLASCAIRLAWGDFDWYTGGDLHGVPDPGEPEWHDMERPVGEAIGEVDVHVVNHHGSIDPASPFFLRALRPRVHVIPSFRPSHPAPVVLKRILTPSAYPGERAVFTTALRESTRIVIGPRADRLAGSDGHVVVRVEAGGARYRVVVVDDSSESDRVLSVHGPWESR